MKNMKLISVVVLVAVCVLCASSAVTIDQLDGSTPIVMGVGETTGTVSLVSSVAVSTIVSNAVSGISVPELDPIAYPISTNAQATANSAPGVTLTLATNLFVRVIETSPGVWQTKLPGE